MESELNRVHPELLTFDCYGTIIDWEAGLESSLRPVFRAHGVNPEPARVLEIFGEIESDAQSRGYLEYREVLRRVLDGMGRVLGFRPSAMERELFAESVKDWPPFSDSSAALSALSGRYKLAIISNIDDDLFAHSQRKIAVDFNWVVTAQQARAYKPSVLIFERALQTFGIPRERILHVAQSRFHDIAPAKQLGIATMWVNRRKGKEGEGATPPSGAEPDREVGSLAEVAELGIAGEL